MKKTLILLLILAFTFSFYSCEKKDPEPQSRHFFEYFDTFGTFSDYSGLKKEEFNLLADRVESELAEYHKLYDIYNEYEGITNLKTINDLAGSGPITVDKKIVNLLLFAKEMFLYTNGNVNVAMGSVLKIWHDYRTEGVELPPKELLEEANKHTDINNLIINEENSTVEITDSKARLDVGAIAKGYAVEMICETLEAEGYSGFVLDLGGNLKAVGTKPSGKGWITGIKNPDPLAEDGFIYRHELKDSSTVTSGNYERYYTVNGKRYHHIINKDTLMPADFYSSVSIITSSSALADALSTAIFNMTPEEAKAFVESKKGLSVVLLTTDGKLEILEGIPHK